MVKSKEVFLTWDLRPDGRFFVDRGKKEKRKNGFQTIKKLSIKKLFNRLETKLNFQ